MSFFLNNIPISELSEQDALSTIHLFISDCTRAIQLSVNTLSSIAKESTALRSLLSLNEKKNLKLILKSLFFSNEKPSWILTLTKIELWQEECLKQGIYSFYGQGSKIFSQGKIWLAEEFLKFLTSEYQTVFTSSQYSNQKVFELIEHIDHFKQKFNAIPFFLNADIEPLFKALSHSVLQISQSDQILGFSVEHALALEENFKEIFDVKFLFFLDCLKRSAISTFAYTLDLEARLKGHIPESHFLSEEAVFEFYGENKKDRDRLRLFSKTVSLQALFNPLFDVFQSAKGLAEALDSTQTNQVVRLRYFNQALEKVTFFNKGYCVGGIREWVMDAERNIDEVQKKVSSGSLNQYGGLHQYSISRNAYLLQTHQAGFQSSKAYGNHFIFKSTLYQSTSPLIVSGQRSVFELNTKAVNQFCHRLIQEVYQLIDAYLISQPYSPIIKVDFLEKGERAHSVGFRGLCRDHKTFYQFRDLNSGEFEFSDIEVLHQWFVHYFSEYLPYARLFDAFQASVLKPKRRQDQEFLISYEQFIQKKALVQRENSGPKACVLRASEAQTEKNIQKKMIQNMREGFHSEANGFFFFKENIALFSELKSPEEDDRLLLLFCYAALIWERPMYDPEGYVNYAGSMVALCQPYTEALNWQFGICLANAMYVYYRRVVNKNIQNEDVFYLKKSLSALGCLLQQPLSHSEAVEVQKEKQRIHAIFQKMNILLSQPKVEFNPLSKLFTSYYESLEKHQSWLLPHVTHEFIQSILSVPVDLEHIAAVLKVKPASAVSQKKGSPLPTRG